MQDDVISQLLIKSDNNTSPELEYVISKFATFLTSLNALMPKVASYTYRMELLSVIPCLDQAVAHRIRSRLVCALVVEIEARSCQSVLDVINN